MSRNARRVARSIALAAVTASVAFTWAVVAAPDASSAATAPRTAILPLDHFLCYHATAPNFPPPPSGVQLSNWLQTTPFTPTFGSVTYHCNPTVKQVQTAVGVKTYTVVHPNAHLLCWAITDKGSPFPVHMTNQFGTSNMETTGGATNLCLPSWKKRSGPPNKTPTAPPLLDHFACYGLVTGSFKYGFAPPGAIKVKDEFSAPAFTSVRVGVAKSICIPTTKFVGGKAYPPAAKNDYSLVCFPVRQTPYWKSFFDENQFGQGEVFPTKQTTSTGAELERLCLPTAAIIG